MYRGTVVMKSARSWRGNMLALIAAATVFIVGIILFILWYANVQMGTSAHRTAIESAALAAATDLGRIVVYTPECGYVSLTGAPPIGSDTVSTVPVGENSLDNYDRQVRSINELLATARLDMMVADAIGDPYTSQLAQNDVANIQKAENTLNTALLNACKPGGTGTDIYGNTVTPYQDALNIYLSNQASKSTYVANSFKLTLGELTGGTQIACPVPMNSTGLPADSTLTPTNTLGQIPNVTQCGQYYRSQIEIPCDNQAFNFASVGSRPAVCDPTKFTTTASDKNFPLLGVVQATAMQTFAIQGKTSTTSFTACANAGGLTKTQAPGAFTISFPDGAIAEFGSPGDIMASTKRGNNLLNQQMTIKEAIGGDFPIQSPQASLQTPTDWSLPAPAHGQLTAQNVFAATFYDWLKLGGSGIAIDSVVTMMTPGGIPFNTPVGTGTPPNVQNPSPPTPNLPSINWYSTDPGGNKYLLGQIPAGILHLYEFKADGTVHYASKPVQPEPYMIVPHLQLYAETNNSINSNRTQQWALQFTPTAPPPLFNGLNTPGGQYQINGTNNFDMFIRSLTHYPGIGRHDGSPVDSDLTSLSHSNHLAWNHDYGAGGTGAGYIQIPFNQNILSTATGPNGSVNTSGAANNAGAPSFVSDKEDFALNIQPQAIYVGYASDANPSPGTLTTPGNLGVNSGVASGTPRPTYTANGIAAEVRFRRVVNFNNAVANSVSPPITGNSGYIGLITPPTAVIGTGTPIDVPIPLGTIP
jgi:hypothetical protein